MDHLLWLRSQGLRLNTRIDQCGRPVRLFLTIGIDQLWVAIGQRCQRRQQTD
ncbi:hypothetical protein GCM10007418_05890 [Halopseudomonas salina]|uniref:Transposase n=1 Tax=Halopseudomonas salina TaxID=1323744 RepID=A0ABQ1P1W3_9GAMM|nr:hypothetical protein GCM10007418_05890 [Halopseudomonas salina]